MRLLHIYKKYLHFHRSDRVQISLTHLYYNQIIKYTYSIVNEHSKKTLKMYF